MAEGDWTDMIAGDRMAVDQEFTGRVQDSEFTRQEWGLIMTAVEFEIERPGSEDARIVADTEKLPQILPEVENVRQQMQGGAGGGGGGGGAGSGSSGGIFDSIKEGLGLGSGSGGVDDEQLAAAERLTQEYADELQAHLESQGRWEQVRTTAAGK